MSYRSPTPVFTCDRCGAGATADVEDGKPPKEWRALDLHAHRYANSSFATSYPRYEDAKRFDICPDCMKSLEKWLTLKQ